MKVSFVIPTIGITGGVKVVFEYANRFIKRGHEVFVIYPIVPPQRLMLTLSSIKPDLRRFKAKLAGTVDNIRRRTGVDWFDLRAKLIRIPSLTSTFAMLCESIIPDADFIFATSWETAYFVNKLSKRKGRKLYFVQHYEIWDLWNDLRCWKLAAELEGDASRLPITMSQIDPPNAHLRKFKAQVDRTYLLPLGKITISSWLKELLTQHFKQEVLGVITNGVDFELFKCEDEKNWNDPPWKILVPYRSEPWKGFQDGLMALEKIKSKYGRDVEIWSFGPHQPPNLPDWVRFIIRPYGEKLRDIYCKSHILVVPSWVEGCQLPPMEGMACGCAVVATNVGGISDYAIAGKTAVVVSPRRPDEIFRAVSYLLDNRDYMREIAESGKNYIRQFTWDRAVQKLESILTDLLNN